MPTNTPPASSTDLTPIPTTYTPTPNRSFDQTDFSNNFTPNEPTQSSPIIINTNIPTNNNKYSDVEEIEENISIAEMEEKMIKKALVKHRGRRKEAAKELGISERTLYRKIRQYEIDA